MLIAPRESNAKQRDPDTLTVIPLPSVTLANVNTAMLPEVTPVKLAPPLIANVSVFTVTALPGLKVPRLANAFGSSASARPSIERANAANRGRSVRIMAGSVGRIDASLRCTPAARITRPWDVRAFSRKR